MEENDRYRISELMSYKNMQAKTFAEATGISSASLSHILNGRNNPTLSTYKAILGAFPEISSDWLIFGDGPMVKGAQTEQNTDNIENQSDMPKQNAEQFVFEQPDLFSSPIVNATNVQPVTSVEAARPQTVVKEKPVIKEVVKYIDKKPRKVVEVRIFYDDGTYETFS